MTVPMIERTFWVRFPNGDVDRVNRFDWNLQACVHDDRYIQLVSGAWIRPSKLTLIGPAEDTDGKPVPRPTLVVRAAHLYPATYADSEPEIELACACHPTVFGGHGVRTGLHGDLAVYAIHPTTHHELWHELAPLRAALQSDGSLELVP